jgi:hypothetical protein
VVSPDKIVCIFNIITFSLVFSSFLTVISILLSDKVLNQFTFLEKYPRVLYFLKLRNSINRKIALIYLIVHLILILFGLIGNIYMFFI